MTHRKNISHGLVELPPPQTVRWVKSRKMAVIRAIESGVLTDQDACQRYGLSEEELSSWKGMVRKFGPDALRATHLRQYRSDQDSVA